MDIEQVRIATENYPKFPDGRIDYTRERVCFVLNCVVICGNKILLTKRSSNVIAYPNTVNGVSGFIDQTDKSLEELARLELSEELNAPLDKVTKLLVGEPFVQVDEEIKREWHVYAVLVEFSETFNPITNWENKSAKWYSLKDADKLQLMRGFRETLQTALNLR